MQPKISKVIEKWIDEFPNVEFQHGPSTDSEAHYIVSCYGFETFGMLERQKMDAQLRKKTYHYIDSIEAHAAAAAKT